MTIRLLEPGRGNGGVSYNKGQILSLSDEEEGNLVASGRAEYAYPRYMGDRESRREFETLLLRKGAVLNGQADDAIPIQEAFDSYTAPGRYRAAIFPEGVVARILSGLTINTNALSVDGAGLTIDASDMTSGYALTLVGQTVIPYNIGSNINRLERIRILGPDTDSTTADGIRVSDNTTTPGHFTAQNVFVRGFRDNVYIGNNHYIQKWDNCHSLYAHRYGLHYGGANNTGESINWFSGSISDSQNAGLTSLALYIPSSSGGPDMHFWGTSFSYNNRGFDIGCGTASFRNVHFESDSNNPMGVVKYTGDRPSTLVVVDGGSITGNGTANGTTIENPKGRPVMFLIDSTTGDRCGFVLRNAKWSGFGRKETELVQFTGAARPMIVIDSLTIDESNNNIGKVCNFTNAVANGGFESAIPGGWVALAGTATITRDTSVFNADAAGTGGAASLKIVGSASTATYSQTTTQFKPGQSVVARIFTRCDAVSAGNFTLKLYMYAADGTTSLSTPTITTVSATQGAFALAAQKHRIPAGVTSIKIELAVTGFTGTIYADDVSVWFL